MTIAVSCTVDWKSFGAGAAVSLWCLCLHVAFWNVAISCSVDR